MLRKFVPQFIIDFQIISEKVSFPMKRSFPVAIYRVGIMSDFKQFHKHNLHFLFERSGKN